MAGCIQTIFVLLYLSCCSWCYLHWWMFALGWSLIGCQILQRKTITRSTQANTYMQCISREKKIQASSNSWKHGCVFLSRVGAGRLLIVGSLGRGCISIDSWNSGRASLSVTSPVEPPRESTQTGYSFQANAANRRSHMRQQAAGSSQHYRHRGAGFHCWPE